MELRSKIARKLNIPEDISEGLPIVTITGKCELYVENYRGIIEYSKNQIRIQTKCGRICITGDELEIVYYTNTDMKIVGKLETMNYS